MLSKPTLALACACALIVALAAAATLRAEPTPEPPGAATDATVTDSAAALRPQRVIQRRIDRYRHETWRWQRLMGRSLTRQLADAPANVEAKIAVWQRVAVRTRRAAQNPPHKRQWLCIHRYEGGWHAKTGNGYYGGLQMDLMFQRLYAPDLLRRKGTADRWTPLEQMWAAERAHRAGRGFYPWPNTARSCGLI
jgi:hypothetical protein